MDRPGCVPIRSYRRAEAGLHAVAGPPGACWPPRTPPGRGASGGARSTRACLRDAWEADRAAGRQAPGQPAGRRSRAWSGFLQRARARQPGTGAHNASIVAGYIEHQALSAAELPVERFFMNVAMSRVLYGARPGRQPRSSRWERVAPPSAGCSAIRAWRGAADLFLSLHNILPDRYPLDGFNPERDPGPWRTTARPPDRLRGRDAAPGSRPCTAFAAADLDEPPAARIRPGRPARLRVGQ